MNGLEIAFVIANAITIVFCLLGAIFESEEFIRLSLIVFIIAVGIGLGAITSPDGFNADEPTEAVETQNE